MFNSIMIHNLSPHGICFTYIFFDGLRELLGMAKDQRKNGTCYRGRRGRFALSEHWIDAGRGMRGHCPYAAEVFSVTELRAPAFLFRSEELEYCR